MLSRTKTIRDKYQKMLDEYPEFSGVISELNVWAQKNKLIQEDERIILQPCITKPHNSRNHYNQVDVYQPITPADWRLIEIAIPHPKYRPLFRKLRKNNNWLPGWELAIPNSSSIREDLNHFWVFADRINEKLSKNHIPLRLLPVEKIDISTKKVIRGFRISPSESSYQLFHVY